MPPVIFLSVYSSFVENAMHTQDKFLHLCPKKEGHCPSFQVLLHDQVDQLILDHDGLDDAAAASQKPQYFRISSQ